KLLFKNSISPPRRLHPLTQQLNLVAPTIESRRPRQLNLVTPGILDLVAPAKAGAPRPSKAATSTGSHAFVRVTRLASGRTCSLSRAHPLCAVRFPSGTRQ